MSAPSPPGDHDHPDTPDGLAVTDGGSPAIDEQEVRSIVDRARDGEKAAFEMLFRRFHDEIYRFATRRLGDPVSGQDAAAATFADAFASIHRFRWHGAPFEAWLYTIARRRVADLLRARGRTEPTAEPPDGIVSDQTGRVDDVMRMRSLIESLRDTEREIIELRFMEDLDVDQTARRVGKTPGAVRVAQHRALTRLRTMLAEGGAS